MNAPSDLIQARFRELALRAAHTGLTLFTRFLEPALVEPARYAAGQARVRCRFYGGYADAERVMAAFYDDAEPEDADFPLVSIRLTWNAKFANPGHRDLLGAVMALGIEREATGDIAMGTYRDTPCAYLFATEEMADYLAANITAAGRATIKAEIAREIPDIAPPEGSFMRLTVQNLRLDAVLAAGHRLSRTEAQKLIAAGLVKLNHVPNLHADAHVAEGDVISARGCGRLRIEALQGESRRGRLALTLFRYGK